MTDLGARRLGTVVLWLIAATWGTSLEAQTSISTEGAIESKSGGFVFPDGSVQVTARGAGSVLSLQGGRFEARLVFPDGSGVERAAQAKLVSESEGYFWLVEDFRPELYVKLLDGTHINRHWWVFAASLTDLEYTLTVVDRVDGAVKSYAGPAGSATSITDTVAFGPSDGNCRQDVDTLCLYGNRFQVEVSWRDFTGGTGTGKVSDKAQTSDSGLFWFFNEDNVELLVKVLDGGGSFEVHIGTFTSVEWSATVTDTCTAATRVYTSPLGELTNVTDRTAFAKAPCP